MLAQIFKYALQPNKTQTAGCSSQLWHGSFKNLFAQLHRRETDEIATILSWASKVEEGLRGTHSFLGFLQKRQKLLSQGSGGLLPSQGTASVALLFTASGTGATLLVAVALTPDKLTACFDLFPAKRTFSAFQGLGRGRGHPCHTLKPVFP